MLRVGVDGVRITQDPEQFAAPRGPRQAPGPSKNGSGWQAGPGERVGTSGDAVLKKAGRRMSGTLSPGA
eukprot:7693782-Pyramimonas_sp.AAC.1